MRRALIALVSTSVVSLATVAAAAPADPRSDPRGPWLTEDGRAVIMIGDCEGGLCGTVRWIKRGSLPDGKPYLDINNRDPTMRSRAICGMVLLYGFKPDGDGAWTDGHIYDPESGKTYTANLSTPGDGTLKVRGYVMMPLMGESQVWHRPTSTVPPCGTP